MPSEEQLREVLLKLRGNGKQFERLICISVEMLLDRRVWSARGGAQFGGDMGTGEFEWPAVKVEAKQYTKGKTLDKRELLGEISEAVTNTPGLDLWILATCVEVPEQIEKALVKEGEERGLGIEIFDLSSSPHCKLPRLLAYALNDVVLFVRENIGSSEGTDIECLLNEVRKQYGYDESLRHEIINATNLFDLVAGQARSDLRHLLHHPQESRNRFSQTIHSSSFIQRKDTFDALEQWYSDVEQQRSLLALCGEEGVGKTWAAFGWLQKKCADEKLLPVILPASEAASMLTVLHGIGTQLGNLFSGSSAEHWIRRVHHWLEIPSFRNRIIVLFDGLNEQPTVQWRPIIDQVFIDKKAEGVGTTGTAGTRTRFPTIATCRTIFWEQKFAHQSHWSTQLLEVLPFSHDELRTYLQLHNHELGTFDQDVLDLLKIPRFCDLAVKYYTEIIESGDITKDRLLYEDWKDRHSRKSNLTLDNDTFQGLMIDLAEQALQGKILFREREFKEFLVQDETERVLTELKTGGVLLKGPSGRLEVEPQRLHHALGLLLLTTLTSRSEAPREELEELIASHLEPRGLDANASICAAAIFGATVQDGVPESIVLLLFEFFFSLQNIEEAEWSKIRGYFPVFPEIYRQLAEKLVTESDRSRKAWGVVEWAYMRWCDETAFQPTLEEHCLRWLSMLPLPEPGEDTTNPILKENQRRKAAYSERLGHLLDSLSKPVPFLQEGRQFEVVETYDLGRLYGLAIDMLSARPTVVNPRFFSTLAVSITVRGGFIGRGVQWIIRFLGQKSLDNLTQEIVGMLGIDNPIWQKAAFFLASALPDERAEEIKRKSAHKPRNFRHRDPDDPCKTGCYLWLAKDCSACLQRKDISFEAKAVNIAGRSDDPNFSLPEDCADHLISGLGELLNSGGKLNAIRDGERSRSFDIDRWEAAFVRWVPESFASFSKTFIEQFDCDQLEKESADLSEDDKKRRVRLECSSRVLQKVALVLNSDNFEQLRRFWRAWIRLPPEKRINESVIGDRIDLLESDLFRILLLSEDDEQVGLIFERSRQSFNNRDLVDVLPLGLPLDKLRLLWNQLFDRSDEELVSKIFLLALEVPDLSLEQRERLVRVAQEGKNGAITLISIFALLSGDQDLVRSFLNAGLQPFFKFVFWKYWTSFEAIPTDISLQELSSLGAPLLSHLMEQQGRQDEKEYLAQALRSFVDSGEEEWSKRKFPHPSDRAWQDFSYSSIRRLLESDPVTLDHLLASLNDVAGTVSPIEHSYWLYYAVCEFLLEESSDKAVGLLDRLIREVYEEESASPSPHSVVSLMARWSQNSEVSDRLSECLDLCLTDTELQRFALTFKEEEDDWLWQKIDADLSSGRPVIAARAMTLAGFAYAFERGIKLLEDQGGDALSWLEEVREKALATARKGAWSKHWFEEFLRSEEAAQSWAYFNLFMRSVDRRYSRLVRGALRRHGFSFRDSSAKMKHLRVNEDSIYSKIEDYERNQYADNFCHSKVEKSIFPWLKQWTLSVEDRRKIISG